MTKVSWKIWISSSMNFNAWTKTTAVHIHQSSDKTSTKLFSFSRFDSTFKPTMTFDRQGMWHCLHQLPVNTCMSTYGIIHLFIMMRSRTFHTWRAAFKFRNCGPVRMAGRSVERSEEKRSVLGWNCLLMALLSPSCEGCSCLLVLRQMEVGGVGELSNQTTANIFSLAHDLATTNEFWCAREGQECGWALANTRHAFSLCRASVGETCDWTVGRVENIFAPVTRDLPQCDLENMRTR